MKSAQKVLSLTQHEHYCSVLTDACEIRISFINDEIVRIRAGFDSDFSNHSFSLIQTSEKDQFDDYLKDERKRLEPIAYNCSELKSKYILKSKQLSVEIEKEPFKICIYDKLHHLLHSDIIDLGYMEDNNLRRIHSSEIFDGDCFYGFGEKSGEFNKSHKFMSMNAGDTFGYDPLNTDGLYKHIPFYIRLNRKSHIASGYFYNTSCECDFDMGRRYSNYWKHRSTFRLNSGDIDLYFIKGPSIIDIVRRFTDLTGRSMLLPKYSLGYLGSSMIYAELPVACDAAILNFIDKARKEEIPIDGFQLSSGYTMVGTKRCVFTWNKLRFPNPKKFIREMEERGIVVSPNVKPGVLTVHPYYKAMDKENIFVKNKNGQTDVGKWWGGKGSFADFTDEHAREIWKDYLKKHLLDYGIHSIWNDNCEYEGIFDDDSICQSGKIAALRPVMANIMCKLTIEAIADVYPNERPFVVCRAGHSGIQRYAQTWSGDNYTSWDSLKYNIATMLGMALCGVSNYGSDVGGFAGPCPEPELFLRWVQCGIFEQRFSIHSVNDDISITEPWMYPEMTDKIRTAIQFRYRLTPYYYSLMYQAYKDGISFMNPVMAYFQDDEKTYDNGTDLMIGSKLLSSPVVEKGQTIKEIYLPKGKDFYNFWTHEKVKGGQSISLNVDLDSIPLFIVEGGIIPMSSNQLMNLQKDKVEELHWLIAPSAKESSFTLYDDDGFTNNYKEGINHIETLSVKEKDGITIHNEISGSYAVPYQAVLMEVICDSAQKVMLNDQSLKPVSAKENLVENSWFYETKTHSLWIRFAQPISSYTLNIK